MRVPRNIRRRRNVSPATKTKSGSSKRLLDEARYASSSASRAYYNSSLSNKQRKSCSNVILQGRSILGSASPNQKCAKHFVHVGGSNMLSAPCEGTKRPASTPSNYFAFASKLTWESSCAATLRSMICLLTTSLAAAEAVAALMLSRSPASCRS